MKDSPFVKGVYISIVGALIICLYSIWQLSVHAEEERHKPEVQAAEWEPFTPAPTMPPGTQCWQLYREAVCDFPEPQRVNPDPLPTEVTP